MSRTNISKGFTSTMNKGFRMTFENGWTISVQFGPGNYCDRRWEPYSAPNDDEVWSSSTAEVAAWNAEGLWFNFNTFQLCAEDKTDVKSYCSTNQVADLITHFASLNE